MTTDQKVTEFEKLLDVIGLKFKNKTYPESNLPLNSYLTYTFGVTTVNPFLRCSEALSPEIAKEVESAFSLICLA